MLNRQHILHSFFIPALIMSQGVLANNTQPKIRSIFNVNELFCALRVNSVSSVDNRYSAINGYNLFSSSSNSWLVLENGENEITLEVGALDWFSNKNSKDKETNQYSTDAYCKVELTAFSANEQKIITRMNVTIDNNGHPQANIEQSGQKQLSSRKIAAWQVEQGHIHDDYFIENLYPQGMTLHRFTQKVYLKGLPEWRWTKATPFTSKPEEILALQNAYNELWRLFVAKDNNAIKNKMHISLNAWSIATDANIDRLYNSYDFVDSFKNKTFKMIPINWKDYTVEITNKGRLVRFVNKSDPTISPLSYDVTAEDGETELRSFSPYLSIVDGRVTPVI